jgi:hypothetical protein
MQPASSLGSHEGRPWAQEPGDYLAWMLRICKLSSRRFATGPG